MAKYEFTDDTIEVDGRKLRRILRLSDGLLGGYIENEDNLSQRGECFVYDNARVYGSAHVFRDAQVRGNAHVYGIATVCGNARVYDSAWVYGDALVYGDAHVFGDAGVYGDARVFGNARVYLCASVYGNAHVYDSARVDGYACVHQNAHVQGDARVYGDAICTRTPLSCSIPQGRTMYITDNNIIIGCENHSIQYWEENIYDIGRKNKYSDNEISKVITLISTLLEDT